MSRPRKVKTLEEYAKDVLVQITRRTRRARQLDEDYENEMAKIEEEYQTKKQNCRERYKRQKEYDIKNAQATEDAWADIILDAGFSLKDLRQEVERLRNGH